MNTTMPGTMEGPQSQKGAAHATAVAESQKLTAALILNLTKLSKGYVRQITKDDSTESALSRLAPNQAIQTKPSSIS